MHLTEEVNSSIPLNAVAWIPVASAEALLSALVAHYRLST